MSARCRVAIGPGRSRVRSRTRMPARGLRRSGSTTWFSIVLLRVLDRPAVVRQLAGLSERDFAAQLGDVADAVFYRLRESRRRRAAHFALQGHAVGSARIIHDEARLQDLLVPPCDFGDLRWLHEHSLYLGGLVGAAHPAADPNIGASTGALPWQYRRQVTGPEPHQRVIRIEAGDDHFADFAFGHGIARAGAHDLQDQRFVEDHAFERLGLVGDQAQVRGGVRLQHAYAAFSASRAQCGWKILGANSRFFERADVRFQLVRLLYDQLQERRRADIGARSQIREGR